MPDQPKSSKQRARHWLQNEVRRHDPPDPKQIRRELGWDIEDAEREERLRHESDSEGGET